MAERFMSPLNYVDLCLVGDSWLYINFTHSLFTKYKRIFNICMLNFSITYLWFVLRPRLIFLSVHRNISFFVSQTSQFMHITKLNIFTLVAEFTHFGKVITVILETVSSACIPCALLENYNSYRFVLHFPIIITCGNMVVISTCYRVYSVHCASTSKF